MLFSLATLSLLTIPTLITGNPLDRQVALQTDGIFHTAESWGYIDCGATVILRANRADC